MKKPPVNKIIIIVLFTTMVSGCDKVTVEYGPIPPLSKIDSNTIVVDNWEISRAGYEFKINSQGVYFLNYDTGFVVGYNGEIYKTTDSGKSWKKKDSGTTLHLLSIDFVNDNTGYVSGSAMTRCLDPDCDKGSLLLKTTDCGESWTKLFFPDYFRIASLKFFDEMHGVAIIYTKGPIDTQKMNVAITSDGGSVWSMVNLVVSPSYDKLFFLDNLIYVPGKNQQIYKSSDYGITWDTLYTPVASNNYIRNLYFINENTGFADGVTDIFKTTDGGSTWVKVFFPFDGLRSLYFYNEKEGIRIESVSQYIGGDFPQFVKSNFYETTNGGISWKKTDVTEPLDLTNAHFPIPGYGFGFRQSNFYKYTRKED